MLDSQYDSKASFFLNQLDYFAPLYQDRVIGILDWELSTLGNQMCDVAYSCLVIISIASLMSYGSIVCLIFDLYNFTCALTYCSISSLPCQHYVLDISLDKVENNGGLEFTGIPEGVPTLAEYLAEYCAVAVRTT